MRRMHDPQLRKMLTYLARKEAFVFLDTSRPDRENGVSLLFLDPVDRLVCRLHDDLDAYLHALQQRLDNGLYLAGWVGYEFGALLEKKIALTQASAADNNLLLADLGVYGQPRRFDHTTGEHDFPFVDNDDCGDKDTVSWAIKNLRPNMAKEEFLAALDRVRQYIIAGDTYQVNLTMKLLFDFTGCAEALYAVLRKNQSVAYSAYIRHGEERILSFSPELFFRKKDDEITVRPMKGTALKGRNSAEEQANSLCLQQDAKNRSENVMIVDLLRNDLARLMNGHGTSRVMVDSLFDIESYESLLQMTSTIKASGVSSVMTKIPLAEIFRALFPCGSITGAPKIRTMQIIDELEKEPRGVYTGAIGYFAPDGSAVFNVPIRTIRLQGGRGEMGIGAGITHDSIAAEEWSESLLKGRFLSHRRPDFQLLETLLWQPGSGYWLLEAHLARLADAAHFFKYAYDEETVRARLGTEDTLGNDTCWRVRLVLAKDGRISLTRAPCAAPKHLRLPRDVVDESRAALPMIDFSSSATDLQESPWLFHKTTMRAQYDAEYKRAREKGLVDVLFCNGADEVTEGCISNLIIYRDGQYLTPPVASGLLPGVMRAHLLADHEVPLVEQVLSRDDVMGAAALFVCNSVRGVVRVKMRVEEKALSVD